MVFQRHASDGPVSQQRTGTEALRRRVQSVRNGLRRINAARALRREPNDLAGALEQQRPGSLVNAEGCIHVRRSRLLRVSGGPGAILLLPDSADVVFLRRMSDRQERTMASDQGKRRWAVR